MVDDPHDPMLGGYTPSKDKYPVEEYEDPYAGQKPGMFTTWHAALTFFAVIFAIWVIIAWILVAKYW